MREEVLLIEGCPVCVDEYYLGYAKRKRKRRSRKMARRRISSGELGALKELFTEDFVSHLKTGALAALGATIVDKLVVEKINEWKGPLDVQLRSLIMIAAGGLLGGVALKITNRRDIAAALTIGPVAMAIINLMGEWWPKRQVTQQSGLSLPSGDLGVLTTTELPQPSLPASPIQQVPTLGPAIL